MDAEVTLFSKPEELIAWADTFDILLNPSIEDAAILLNSRLQKQLKKQKEEMTANGTVSFFSKASFQRKRSDSG